MSGLDSSAHVSSLPMRVEAPSGATWPAGGGNAPRRSLSRVKPETIAIINALRDCYARGMSTRQACEAVGIEKKVASRIARVFSVKPKPEVVAAVQGKRINAEAKARHALIVERVKAGESPNTIARDFGISHKTVRLAAEKAGISIAKQSRDQYTPAQDAQMQEMQARGMSARDIADAMGLNRGGVSARLLLLKRRAEEKPKVVEAAPVSRVGIIIEHADKSKQAQRRCLCGCGRMFLSVFPGERISPTCRDAWSSR